MPQYRRSDIPGGTYFFTVVTHRRRRCFTKNRTAIYWEMSFATVRQNGRLKSMRLCSCRITCIHSGHYRRATRTIRHDGTLLRSFSRRDFSPAVVQIALFQRASCMKVAKGSGNGDSGSTPSKMKTISRRTSTTFTTIR